jgi:cytochrome d ubiquinol oxidase subunit II
VVWLFLVLAIVGAILVRLGSTGKDRTAFYGSSLAGASMVGIWAASIFPELVPSLGPGEALTVANASSSQLTLTVMLIIAAIGVPLVLFYFFLIYRTYAGRIDMTQGTDGHY